MINYQNCQSVTKNKNSGFDRLNHRELESEFVEDPMNRFW